MRKLLLSAVIAVTAMLTGSQVANAGCCEPACDDPCETCCEKKCGFQFNFLCFKKKVCTQEVCRRYFYKTKCVCGCPKKIRFVEITYKTTYRNCCGECSYKTFKNTKRACSIADEVCDPKNYRGEI